MARTWICRSCGNPTTFGTLCQDCSRGFGRAVHNPAYDTPEWRRTSRRLIGAHVAKYGRRCLRCRRASTPNNPLTVNHGQMLALGGQLVGPDVELEVMCRSCNSRLRWLELPTRRRAPR